MPTSQPALERELQSILIRHLPVGLEGIGLAQTNAVLGMLNRREKAPRSRPTLDSETQRSGMRLLKQTALSHQASATITPLGDGTCGLCRSPDGDLERWPCPVWTAAELLGLVDDAAVEVG